LLHLALTCPEATKANAMVYYLCTTCPALIHTKCNKGETPLHLALISNNFEAVNILCNIDVSVLECQCTPSDISDHFFQALPLHFLTEFAPPRLEVSNEGDYFRLFLSLYPASAGIKDGHLISPYDLAVSLNLSAYFLRLLLAADPAIDPLKRRDMNFAARRDGMFLAFRALSSNRTPIIWARIRHEGKDLLARVISYL
jgi:ankyrin repeat protein